MPGCGCCPGGRYRTLGPRPVVHSRVELLQDLLTVESRSGLLLPALVEFSDDLLHGPSIPPSPAFLCVVARARFILMKEAHHSDRPQFPAKGAQSGYANLLQRARPLLHGSSTSAIQRSGFSTSRSSSSAMRPISRSTNALVTHVHSPVRDAPLWSGGPPSRAGCDAGPDRRTGG